MKNIIGHIHDTRTLSQTQIDKVKAAIKELMHLDTIDIIPIGNALYEVSTDDSNIVDFKLDEYNSDKVSMVKYRSYDDSGKRNNAGATLTSSEIKAKE